MMLALLLVALIGIAIWYMHWRSTTHRPAHYVILSRIAANAVLAHELGHFLGNRRHSQTPARVSIQI